VLLQTYGSGGVELSQQWPSDTARGWGALAVGLLDIDLEERLNLARGFATDSHFSVREWAWIAIRRNVITDLTLALELLGQWAEDDDPFVRRFTSEATRPRGVWCPHIPTLKTNPEKAVGLLDKLSADGARYVQLSVGNWLNDAGKTRPDWTTATCARWSTSPSPSTLAIVKRAMRSLARSPDNLA
jgi:3-methyladenine DNA glycosylase AlkC